MTLDIFFDRYLITVHAIVVALGLVLYVAAARALPQRRDPSAADRLGGRADPAAVRRAAALLHVRQPQAPDARRAAARRCRRREGAADDAEAASLWARRLGRSMGLAPAAGYRELRIHADGAEARAAALELIAGATRTIDVCTFILSTDGLGDEIAQALRSQAERGVKVRLLIDGIGAWLGGRLDMKALKRSGVEVGEVRAAVPLDPARPRQPAQPPQDDRRRRRAAVVRRPQLRRRVLRGRSGEARRHVLAQPRLARPQLRPARRARRPRLRAVREGLGLCGPRAGRRRAAPRRYRPRRERGTAGAAGAERAGAGRRHRAVAAGLGLLHGAAAGSWWSRPTSFPTRRC